ncbi:class I SAM-dependent methyltransferase [Chondromyces apiculatus]|uniref:Methyltransferase domain-containing protein n=1 Tax=Chondromyces apiculatus DSM 436 TaxID=1192034 RepID=A0A017TAP3_9BACT|nr:class I SAM-dependent methyltransferase [Chondromyces apiculatus]EYF06353.1 Hypothetical protein CAP_1883 [Chondromyces apiculatus DSM 436]
MVPVPVSLSAPPPEVSDDDWGAPSDAEPAPAQALPAAPSAAPAVSERGPSAQAATEPWPGASSAAPAVSERPAGLAGAVAEPPSVPPSLDAPTSVSNPLALRTIPRPSRRPVSIPPADPSTPGTSLSTAASPPPTPSPSVAASPPVVEEAEAVSIQPVRIIDVMSDLPPVESVPPPAISVEDEETATGEEEPSESEEEAGLQLRLLADGPTPLDAREYLRSLETEPPPPEDEATVVEDRAAFEEVEPESLEEDEVPPTAPRQGTPSIPGEVELRGRAGSMPEAQPDSVPEVEPERDSDTSEEIAVDLTEEAAITAPRPPRPPPRRPQAMAALDLPPYVPAAPTAVEAAPSGAPAAGQPPPLKSATKTSGEHSPVTDPDAPRRKKSWWEDLFSEDFIRTLDRAEPRMVRREADFIEERLGMERGAVILDLACGPGQHAVELASRGYSVVGYDLSLAMLALASEEAQERGQKLNFLQGDMREMAFEETFDAVYCWATSFGYFDEEKNADILTRIHRALRSGGMLLLDVINRDYVACRQPSLVWFEGEGCVCMDEMQVDFFTSRLKVKRTVMFEDGRSRELDYSIRLYNLHELGKLLHEAGFKVTEVTGHPAHPGVFFGSESPRLIILAERS